METGTDVLRARWGQGSVFIRENRRVAQAVLAPTGWGGGIRGNSESRILILCAEPGMGKSRIMREVLDIRSDDGQETRFLNVAAGSGNPVDMIMRFSRSCAGVARQNVRLTVGIDNVPAEDECGVASEVRALRRMTHAGCDVIVALRPEAASLADELPEALCLRSADLACPEDDIKRESGKLWELTLGIPSLVEPARAELTIGSPIPKGGRYYERLRLLVRSSLRKGLPQEERRIRFAMLLLGQGTLNDLCAICQKIDADALTWLRRDAPLFGIDGRAESFSCLPLLPAEALDACSEALKFQLASIDGGIKVAAAVADVLARRGSYLRAAAICMLGPDSDEVAAVCRSWGCELVACGETRVVKRSLEVEPELSADPLDECARYALLLAEHSSKRKREEPALLRLSGSGLSARHAACSAHARLLHACRALRAEIAAADELSGDGERPRDFLARALALHVRARALLLEGHFYDAFCLLVNSPERVGSLGLVSALLADDYEIAQVLSGEVPDSADKACSAEAAAIIKGVGNSRLTTYRRLLEPLLGVVAGGQEDLPDIEYGISKAETQGDVLTQAAFLIGAAITDLRKEAFPRAHVRAQQATGLAMKAGCAYLEEVARVFDAAAQLSLGNEDAIKTLGTWGSGSSAVLDVLRLFIHAQDADTTSGVRFDVLSYDMLPRDLGWLISILAYDLGTPSANFVAVLPPHWLSPLEQQRHAMEISFGDPSCLTRRRKGAGATGLAEEGSGDGGKRIHVNVLGRFEVFVDGQLVDPRQFQKRRARELLMLLCVARGHKVRRYEALDAIWGSTDYVSGLHRIYEATSSIRVAVDAKRHGCDPVRSSKSEGTISLNEEVVECDIDAFIAEAEAALEGSSDDKEVMRHADAMNVCMPGGFDAAMRDIPPMAGTRLAELRLLYTDAAVAGCEAALRSGRPHVAERLARAAHQADDLREDAVTDLLRALGALGRGAEMRKTYDQFARHFISVTKMPPSKHLRDVFKREYGGEREHDDAGKGQVAKMPVEAPKEAARVEAPMKTSCEASA